jgi:hypothetical protein
MQISTHRRRLDKQKHMKATAPLLFALAFSPVFMGILYEIIGAERSHRQRLEPLYTHSLLRPYAFLRWVILAALC